ncbi:MAG TPA: murein biosynthesis integral membrane protein MurJ, partial [Candidatus Aminicenantes bacterium]|nr:murein biosynthesis integral membrane protein MurJ [Candidatus Aminicenantes bacterium]
MEDISRGVRSFTIGTALSRVMGLVRESVFAHLFGAGAAMDAFKVAFRIPNLLRDLFAETALSAAFVPVLTAEKVKSKEAQNRLASNIFNVLFVVTGVVALAGYFLSPYLAKWIAFGFGKVPGKVELTADLTAVLFPFLIFVSLAAWAMSYLNTEKSFFVPSLAPAFFNLFSILVPLLTYGWYAARGKNPAFGMALGVLAGGLMQFLVQMPLVRRKGFRHSFVLSFRDPQFRRVMALFIPVAIGLAGTRINVLVNTILVTPLEQGSVSWLDYAFRIMHLPLGLFGIAVGTVALPSLSRLVLDNNVASIRATLTDSLKMVLFLTVPTSALIAFLAHPITRIIYQRGRFT